MPDGDQPRVELVVAMALIWRDVTRTQSCASPQHRHLVSVLARAFARNCGELRWATYIILLLTYRSGQGRASYEVKMHPKRCLERLISGLKNALPN